MAPAAELAPEAAVGGRLLSRHPAQPGARHFIEILEYRQRHQRDRVAFTFLKDGETEVASLTFGELGRRAASVGAELRRRGASGERVLLLYPQGLDFVVAFFGVLYAGGTCVPAPRAQISGLSGSRLEAIVDDAKPRLALVSSSLLEGMHALLSRQRNAPAVATLEDVAMAPERGTMTPRLVDDHLVLLQYTSGSTGAPKGVMISNANVLSNLEMIRRFFEFGPDSIAVSWLPMFHDMGLIGCMLEPVYAGYRCILMSPVAFLQEPGRWLRAISRYRATSAGGPNFGYDLCVDRTTAEQRAELDLSSWDNAFNGSEPVQASTLDRFAQAFAAHGFRREAFYPCYGMAEATLFISGGAKVAAPVVRVFDDGVSKRSDSLPEPVGQSRAKKIVGCGRTGSDHRLLIVDPNSSRPLPDGEIGEIWFAGPSVSSGYWNRPRETAEAFDAGLSGAQGGGFLRTGDLGYVQGGEVFVTGRTKDLMIVRGQNHYPQDIEATVQVSHPALRQNCGAAFLVEDDHQQCLVVVQEVARRYLRQLPLKEIVGNLRAAVAKEHGLHVAAAVLLKPGALPKTSSGKIQRGLCRSRFLSGTLPIVGQDRHGAAFWEKLLATGAQHGDQWVAERLRTEPG